MGVLQKSDVYQPDNAVLIVAAVRRGETRGVSRRRSGRFRAEAPLPVFWTVLATHEAANFHRAAPRVSKVIFGYRVPSSLRPASLTIGYCR